MDYLDFCKENLLINEGKSINRNKSSRLRVKCARYHVDSLFISEEKNEIVRKAIDYRKLHTKRSKMLYEKAISDKQKEKSKAFHLYAEEGVDYSTCLQLFILFLFRCRIKFKLRKGNFTIYSRNSFVIK